MKYFKDLQGRVCSIEDRLWPFALKNESWIVECTDKGDPLQEVKPVTKKQPEIIVKQPEIIQEPLVNKLDTPEVEKLKVEKLKVEKSEPIKEVKPKSHAKNTRTNSRRKSHK